jgi:hypothetical protein
MKITHFIVFCFSFTSLSCRPFTSMPIAQDSGPQGLVNRGLVSYLFPPPPKPEASLANLGKSMVRLANAPSTMKSPVGLFRGSLFSAIISSGGIPRGQIKEILEQILSSKNTACGGATCSRVFGIKPTEIDLYLDDALDSVKKSPRLAQPDMVQKKVLLIRSLEKLPPWLSPADFGDPLTPRKAYDLRAEIATFKGCSSCSISSDEEKIRSMIAGARQGDHFVWALRPDGRLVIGRGPDEKMSHGVLASRDLVDERLTKNETLPVLASGEGYVDLAQKKLVLNNKSGHYRPEFRRVDNPSIRRLFEALLPDTTTGLKFVDQTKPR